ncbi:la-related protein 1C-like [Carex rostrata]
MDPVPDPPTSPPTLEVSSSVKKPVWNIPSNGSIEVKPPVIDESSWPALSESAKSPLKPSDGSTATSVAAPSSPSPSKPQFANQNPNSPTNSKKTTRRNINLSPNGPIPAMPPQNTPNSDTEKAVTDSWDAHTQVRQGNRENTARGGRGYNGNRRNGNGNRGGVHHGGGRGRNGGGFEGQYRNLSGREMNGPPPHGFAVSPYVRPPPPPPLPGAVPAPFIPSPGVRPSFGAPVFPEMAPPSPVYYVPPGAAPFVPHPVGPAAVFFPPPPVDPQRAALVKQIDYYFSYDNLCKDTWLRGQMDDQGWVPISLIAGFNKVKLITTNIPFILETMRLSALVEVQGDKIRKRGDWMNWILPPETPVTPSQSTQHSTDNLTAQFQTVSVASSSNQSGVTRSGESGSGIKSAVEEEVDHTQRN